MICSSCASTRWVSPLVLSILLMWLYGYSKRNEFTLCLFKEILALGGPKLDVWIFLLHYFFLDLCFINSSLNFLLSITHPNFFFRYIIEKFLGIWEDLDWYCWPVGLWRCWFWFGTLCQKKALPNFLLTIWPILIE